MRLSIDARLLYRFPQACEVLLLVEAARSPDQTVLSESLVLTPDAPVTRLDDPVTGERRLVFQAEGEVDILYQAQVEVPPRETRLQGVPAASVASLPPEVLPYLRPSRYCHSDRFQSFVAREFGHLDGGDKAAAILDWIADHVDYRPGSSDASTTAEDTFVDRAGVCRDFTHLAIALLRAADLPARAMSAHAFKLTPPDLHAVVEVWLEGGWRVADSTRLAPPESLVRIATGHDAADIGFMTVFGTAELIAQSFAVWDLPGRAAPAA
jgi:transglutaminase-like putative cysteine protease